LQSLNDNPEGDILSRLWNIRMARTSKGRSCWYGYLMAGERSSPLLRDGRLETRNAKTIYMYNLKRGERIEYALEIVEKKLRELTISAKMIQTCGWSPSRHK